MIWELLKIVIKRQKQKKRKEKNSEQTSGMVTELFIFTTPITAFFIQEICLKTLLSKS